MAGNAVQLVRVSKVFSPGTRRETRAVDDVSLNVAEGEFVTLLGPSGCGKTTTLRMIAGFELLTAGEIRIGEQCVNDIPPNRRNVAMVFQSYGLFPHMTVFENVAYGLRVRRRRRREIRERVGNVLKLVGLEGLSDRAPQQISGGQQQRVALSRAIVVEPRVLLFDEPLSNLDAKLRVEMRKELRNLQQRLGITSIYVTHDQEEAMSISDRLVVMDQGRVQQVGSPDEIYARPANQFVADFIGKANFLPGTIVSTDERLTIVRLQHGRSTLELPSSNTHKVNEEVTVMIRPEAMDVIEEHQGDLDGTVRFAQFTGALAVYDVELSEGRRVEVRVSNPREWGLLHPGDTIGLRLHRTSLHLLPREQ